jgi:hypothetical protein
MRRILMGGLMAAVTVSAGAQTPAVTAKTTDLAFMTGCWRLEQNGREIDEHWLAPAGGMLVGVSRTVAGGKTTEFEFMQIRDVSDGLTYTAKPSGQPEASFKAASVTPEEVVFENPAHDFPQRIRYRRSGADGLHARIEGTMNGKTRGFDFPYTRAACVPR